MNLKDKKEESYPELGNGIFFAYDYHCFNNPSLIESKLKDIISRGFSWVNLQFRGGYPLPFDDPRSVKNIREFVKRAHKTGLKVLFQLDPKFFAHNAAHRHPELTQRIINFYKTKLTRGAFTFKIDYTGRMRGTFLGIECVFLCRRYPDGTYSDIRDITKHVKWEQIHDGCTISTPVSMWKPIEPFQPITINGESGMTIGSKSGTSDLIVATKHHTMAVDWSNTKILHTLMKEMINLYKGIQLDGIGWDEPGSGCCFKNWQSWGGLTESFYKTFKQRYGYELREKLWALIVNDRNFQAPVVRYHYFDHLCTVLVNGQIWFFNNARKKFGSKMHMGIHHTCHEYTEDDLNYGSLDVFRCNRGVTAGFTDSTFDREDGMLFNTVLARSMGKISKSGQAYNNSWNFLPTSEELDYYTRLYAACGVNWLAHIYGAGEDGGFGFGPGYPFHPTWENIPECVNRLSKVQDILKGYKAKAEVALLYNWETPAALGDYNYMHTHYFALMLALKELMLAGYRVDILSSEILGQAKIEGKELISRIMNGRYHSLVVSWPFFIQPETFKCIKDFSRAGGIVIIFGYPPEFSSDGRRIGKDFADMIGLCKPVDWRKWTAADSSSVRFFGRNFKCDPVKAEANYYNLHGRYYQPLRCFSVKPDSKTDVIGTMGDNVIAVRKNRTVYAGIEMPLYPGALKKAMFELGAMPEIEVSEEVLVGLFERDGKEKVVVSSRGNVNLDCMVKYDNKEIKVRDCRLAVLDFSSKKCVPIVFS